MTRKKRVWSGSKDSGKHSFSSSPSDPTVAFLADETDSTTKPVVAAASEEPTSEVQVPVQDNPVTVPLVSAKLHNQTQEELSKKLEEFRIKSRSTKASFVDRPRAKSEEAMIKFSNESMFQPQCRVRLQSDSTSPQAPKRSGFFQGHLTSTFAHLAKCCQLLSMARSQR